MEWWLEGILDKGGYDWQSDSECKIFRGQVMQKIKYSLFT